MSLKEYFIPHVENFIPRYLIKGLIYYFIFVASETLILNHDSKSDSFLQYLTKSEIGHTELTQLGCAWGVGYVSSAHVLATLPLRVVKMTPSRFSPVNASSLLGCVCVGHLLTNVRSYSGRIVIDRSGYANVAFVRLR